MPTASSELALHQFSSAPLSECVRMLNVYFHIEENVTYERHVLRQLKREPGEDMFSFVLGLKKQATYCGYALVELDAAVRN